MPNIGPGELILILAVILAFIYNFFCSRAERKARQGEA
jgi:hypothetical protein